MDANRIPAIRASLVHEGGYVDHPRDPGGATNRGVTIGTMRSLGLDLDGDGDVDKQDVRLVTEDVAIEVYTVNYWDAVKGDQLPAGLDYAVFDYGVNSGPRRARRELQAVVGAKVDGIIGPKTMEAVRANDPRWMIDALCDRRLDFLKGLSHWGTFGKGWSRRVRGVRSLAKQMADSPAERPQYPAPSTPTTEPKGLLGLLLRLLRAIGNIKFGG